MTESIIIIIFSIFKCFDDFGKIMQWKSRVRQKSSTIFVESGFLKKKIRNQQRIPTIFKIL